MLQNDLYGARFLDLFAGSGAIGIEALSRGAKEAVFVDKGDGQISCIRENLKTTHLEEKIQESCPVKVILKHIEQGLFYPVRGGSCLHTIHRL